MKKTRIIKKPHVLEKVVEAFYKREIAKLGGISYKFNSQSRRAVSDQITLLYGSVFFVEMKAYSKKMTPTQVKFAVRIRDNGVPCVCLCGRGGVRLFIQWLNDNAKALKAVSSLNKSITETLKPIYEVK